MEKMKINSLFIIITESNRRNPIIILKSFLTLNMKT